MERTMHECLSLDKTSGWITQILTDDGDEQINEIKSNMDWQTNGARIHCESGFREHPRYGNWNKKQGTFKETFTTVTVSLIDDKEHTKCAYVLRNRGYNAPTLQYLSRTGNRNRNIQKGSEEYFSVLQNIASLLDNEDMDLSTSTMLTYILEQMQLEECDTKTCPVFLLRFVELGNQQREERIRQRQGKSTFQKTLEQLNAPYKKECGSYKEATYPPVSEENDFVK